MSTANLPHPVETFQRNFNKLNRDTVHLAGEIYTDDIHFIDPVHEIHGLKELKTYFARLYDGVVRCQFDFDQPIMADGEATIPWVMHLEHGRFRPGRQVHVPGMSHIRFAGKVTYHRDYFDLGHLIYERVPVLGSLIRGIKARL